MLRYPGLNPHSEVLPRGHRKTPHSLPLPCDILLEKDFTLPMRDGVKLYCDIYRPAAGAKAAGIEQDKVPIIVVYAPYGKEGNSVLFLDKLPERMGITEDMYSGYENFEGPDPAYW